MIGFLICLIFAGLLAVSAFLETKPNKNILIGVKLPLAHQKDKPVLAIVKKYQSQLLLLWGIAVLLALPLIWLPNYMSLLSFYIAVWMMGCIAAYTKLCAARMQELYALKQENEWFVGGVCTVNIDTEVSREKDKMPVSVLWFLPAFLIASAAPLYLWLSKNTVVPLWSSLLAFVFPAIGLFMYWLYLSRPTEVFCESTEVNLACNRVWRRRWSICCVMIGNVCAALSLPAILIPARNPGASLASFLLMISILIVVLCAVFFTYQSVRDTQNRYLALADRPMLADDDVYWLHGFYNNPNDPRINVEKRFGIGFTINLGNPKGKVIAVVTAALVVAMLIGMFAIFLAFDTATFPPVIENGIVTINAPLYSDAFALDEIQEIEEIQNIPTGTRTNGLGSSSLLVGHFSLSGYGNSMLFVYNGKPPYLAIHLKDRVVILNGKTPEETRQYHRLLTQAATENREE